MASRQKTRAKPQGAAHQQLKAKLVAVIQQMAELKKSFQAKLETEKEEAFEKGYGSAMQKANQTAKANHKAMLKLAQTAEKAFAKLTTAKAPKKATKGKKMKTKKAAKRSNHITDSSED